ncbi:MAG: HEAT repeat domain-containing protein [Planctomycetes bacterium]|nr:HEAT repeat domain-containing protein [Planctomycetota bacterium]
MRSSRWSAAALPFVLLVGVAGLVGLLRGDASGTNSQAGQAASPRHRSAAVVVAPPAGRPASDASAPAVYVRAPKAADGAAHSRPASGEVSTREFAAPLGGEADMPTRAADFVELLASLAHQPEAGHDCENPLDAVLGDFVSLLAANPDERRAALAQFERESRPEVLELLSLALGQVGKEDVRGALCRIAETDADIERRGQALSALGFYDAPEAMPVALQVLRTQSDPRLLSKAVEALPDVPPATLGAERRAEVVGQLAALAGSASPEVRIRAYRALADWGDEGRTPTLLAGLRDADMTVRATAAYALALRSESSRPARAALVALLQDPREDPEVRGTAADALRQWVPDAPEVKSAVRAFYEAEATLSAAHSAAASEPAAGTGPDAR